jgi:hypothetical protein
MMKEKTSCTKSEANVPFASLPLFAQNSSTEILPGSLNDDSLVREVVTEAIKRSGKSREQVADEMSRTLGLSVTARMIAGQARGTARFALRSITTAYFSAALNWRDIG